jgi:molecular chaperone GrpE
MSDEKIEPAGDELAGLRAKAEEYLELAKRATADFINYQDRVRRDRQDWTRQAVEAFVRDFLPALDGLSSARFEDPRRLEAVRHQETDGLRVQAKHGIVPIETGGKGFDPLYHEAVAAQEGTDRADGSILEEARRGWMIDGRVLRPASVRFAKGPPPAAGV